MSTSYEGKVALITGITGQDGSYLTEFLLEKGYTVRCLLETLGVFVAIEAPLSTLLHRFIDHYMLYERI